MGVNSTLFDNVATDNSMSQEKKDWVIALAYVALIYATLGYVRAPLGFLRAQGWLRLFLGVLYLSCCIGFLSVLILRSTGEIWRYLTLVVIWGIYYAVTQQ